MPIPEWVERPFLQVTDELYARLPRPRPLSAELERVRVVSHRGEHLDRPNVRENSLAAFDAVEQAGVWGIEIDLRWTADLVPVVFHDADLSRMTGEEARLADLSFSEIRRRCPWVPSLGEVVFRYGGRLHLMIEIKAEPYPEPQRQADIVREILAPLVPGGDFHLMSLDLAMFEPFESLPPRAFVPIAQLDIARLSRHAMEAGFGGVSGHYVFLTRRRIRAHHRLGQCVGTGFADSRFAFYREARRGVDWIFSNRAVALENLRRALSAD